MGLTGDIGKRIELVPMDPHFHDISIGLYRQPGGAGPVFRVHTYSSIDGARDRIAFVGRAMAVLGGMEQVENDAALLRFTCDSEHPFAARRVFLEACKIPSSASVEPRPLSILDKKSGQTITVRADGSGVYDVVPEGSDAGRSAAVAGGLAKLAEMSKSDAASTRVTFTCGQSHDTLIGLLLGRALNVRATLREEEMAASRGVLVAPSAQR